MKELILTKDAKNGVTKSDQRYFMSKGIKKFSYGSQNFIFQGKYFAY